MLDFAEQAIALTRGWVYIGDRFIEDFLEIEATVGVELLVLQRIAGWAAARLPGAQAERVASRPPRGRMPRGGPLAQLVRATGS